MNEYLVGDMEYWDPKNVAKRRRRNKWVARIFGFIFGFIITFAIIWFI